MHKHRLRHAAALLFTLLLPATHRADAQAGIPQLEDASIAPKGLLRFRPSTIWTRYESRFSANGPTPLGAPYDADSLGVGQIPDLAAAQTAMQAAAGSPFILSLGQSRFSALAREEEIPLTFEYGVTRRLQVSLMVPVLRKRRNGFLRLDSIGSTVGPNPQRLSSTAVTTNALVQSQFTNAVTQLQAMIASCNSNPSGTGCANLLARQAEAQQLIQTSQSFAASVGDLYGKTGTTGMAFVPLSASGAQTAIANRVAGFNTLYKDLLSQGTDLVTAVPAGAIAPAGPGDIEGYFYKELKRDSIQAKEVQSIGDYEVGAKFLAVDISPQRAGALAMRVALGGSVRFASGSRRAPAGVTDMRVGDGGVGFDVRAVMDLQRWRLGLISAASFTSVGSGPQSQPNDASRYAVDLAPRLHLSTPLAVHGAWSIRHGDFTGTTQLIGGGVSFTTVNSFRPGARPLPMEMRFTHLQATDGADGQPRIVRDQLEVRVYFQLRGRRAAPGDASRP